VGKDNVKTADFLNAELRVFRCMNAFTVELPVMYTNIQTNVRVHAFQK